MLTESSVLGEGYPANTPDTDPKLQALDPPLETQIRNKAKEVLVEDELLRRRYVLV